MKTIAIGADDAYAFRDVIVAYLQESGINVAITAAINAGAVRYIRMSLTR